MSPSGGLSTTKLVATNLQFIETFNVVGWLFLRLQRCHVFLAAQTQWVCAGFLFFCQETDFLLFGNIDYHSARSGVQQSNRLVVLWSLDQKRPQAFLVCGERDFRDIIYTTLPPPWNRGHGQVQGRTSHNPILLAGNGRSGRGGRGVPAWWRCWSECIKH